MGSRKRKKVTTPYSSGDVLQLVSHPVTGEVFFVTTPYSSGDVLQLIRSAYQKLPIFVTTPYSSGDVLQLMAGTEATVAGYE